MCNKIMLLILFLFIFTLLSCPQPGTGESEITWTPGTINRTLGNGQNVNYDIYITFSSSRALENIDLVASEDIEEFVHISPSHFNTLNNDTEYETTLKFIIPHDAIEGIYTGTLNLVTEESGEYTPLPISLTLDFGDIIISDNVKTVYDENLSTMISATSDLGTIVFDPAPPELDDLSGGNVLICQPTTVAPRGIMRQVESASRSGDTLTVTTNKASLSDVLDSGTIKFNEGLLLSEESVTDLTARGFKIIRDQHEDMTREVYHLNQLHLRKEDLILYDEDGDHETTNDQVVAEINIILNFYIDFELVADLSGLHYFKCVPAFTGEAEIEAEIIQEIAGFAVEKELFEITFAPIPVPISPLITLLFYPEIETDIGAEANIGVGCKTGVTITTDGKVGFIYDGSTDEFTSVHEANLGFDNDPILPSVQVNFLAYVAFEGELELYDCLGPAFIPRFYVNYEADFFANPWWELTAGMDLMAGLDLEIPFFNIEYEWEFPLAAVYETTIAQADGPFIAGDLHLSAIVLNPDIEMYYRDDIVNISTTIFYDGPAIHDAEFVVNGYNNDNLIYESPPITLPPGSSREIDFDHQLFDWYDNSIRIVVDPEDEVFEFDEENNEVETSLYVAC